MRSQRGEQQTLDTCHMNGKQIFNITDSKAIIKYQSNGITKKMRHHV